MIYLNDRYPNQYIANTWYCPLCMMNYDEKPLATVEEAVQAWEKLETAAQVRPRHWAIRAIRWLLDINDEQRTSRFEG